MFVACFSSVWDFEKLYHTFTVTLVGQDGLVVVLKYFGGMAFLAPAQLLPAGTFIR